MVLIGIARSEDRLTHHVRPPAKIRAYAGEWIRDIALDERLGFRGEVQTYGNQQSMRIPAELEISTDREPSQEFIELLSDVSGDAGFGSDVWTGRIRFSREEKMDARCLFAECHGRRHILHEAGISGWQVMRVSVVSGASRSRDLMFVQWNPWLGPDDSDDRITTVYRRRSD